MGKWKKPCPLKLIMTKDQEVFLRANWQTMTAQQLADAIGMKRRITRQFLYDMGLYKIKLEYWTDEQVQYLRENYKTIGDVEIAEIFNAVYPKIKVWKKGQINKKRDYLKLVRTADEIQAIRERNVHQGRYSINHYKRWLDRITPVGETRMWKYSDGRRFKVIKTESGFVHYARWLYYQHHGPIPPGHVVRLKDNDPENVVVDNLMLITWGQNGSMNSVYRYPKELVQTIKLLNKLNRTIHEKQNTGSEGSHVCSTRTPQ